MSRSWTRRLGLEADLRVGIALTSTAVCAVAVGGDDCANIAWIKQEKFDQPLLTPEKPQTVADSLYKALSPIFDSIKNEPYPIHVVLPDTVIRTSIFDLDDLPKSKATLSSLARWKMSGELGRSENELVCQTMVLGNDNGKHLIYVQAADRYWLELIKSTFDTCRIAPWTINSASYFRHNYMNSQGLIPSSAMLSVDDGCWTLQAWDSDTRIRFTVTRLMPHQFYENADIIYNELTRVIRAWKTKQSGFTINTLYLVGSRECMDMLACREHSELFNETVSVDVSNSLQINRTGLESSLASLAMLAAATE